jgi:tetratricopeptide (TPR) repeat protein
MQCPSTRLSCVAALVCTALFLAGPPAFAAGSSEPSVRGDSDSDGSPALQLYTEAVSAISHEKYQEAVELLKRADQEQPDNPDVLNMLAYSYRKLGNLDEAFSLYGRALELRPGFPEAREYLGEAHIDAALEQLRLLERYGARADKERASLAAALRAAAAGLNDEAAAAPPKRSW